jgi:hypothetical protein
LTAKAQQKKEAYRVWGKDANALMDECDTGVYNDFDLYQQ